MKCHMPISMCPEISRNATQMSLIILSISYGMDIALFVSAII